MFKVGDKVLLKGNLYFYLDLPEDSLVEIVKVEITPYYVEYEDNNEQWIVTNELDYTETDYIVLDSGGEEYRLVESQLLRPPDTRPKEEQVIEKIRKLWERQEYVKARI